MEDKRLLVVDLSTGELLMDEDFEWSHKAIERGSTVIHRETGMAIKIHVISTEKAPEQTPVIALGTVVKSPG